MSNARKEAVRFWVQVALAVCGMTLVPLTGYMLKSQLEFQSSTSDRLTRIEVAAGIEGEAKADAIESIKSDLKAVEERTRNLEISVATLRNGR